MIRDNFSPEYTDDDKRNLVIRQHTPEEIAQNKRHFSKKQWKRRLILTLLFILFLGLTCIVTLEKLKTVLAIITFLIPIYGISTDFWVTIHGAKEAGSPHYVELYISEKLPVETEVNYTSEQGGFESFYPVKAMDTTSKYECLYYLSYEEYKNVEPGQTLKVNVFPKKLEIREVKKSWLSSINIWIILGALFMLVSAMMLPGVIYSLTNESDNLQYIGIAIFIISFFLFGTMILIGGIKKK